MVPVTPVSPVIASMRSDSNDASDGSVSSDSSDGSPMKVYAQLHGDTISLSPGLLSAMHCCILDKIDITPDSMR